MNKNEGRHTAEELLILKEAVENTNEGFVTINEDHRVIFFNQAAEKIFGYSRQEVLGHDLSVIMVPTCAKDHKGAVERYLKTGKGARIGHETELLATRKNGQQFPAAISFSVTRIGGKHFFTGLVRDLTETKVLQTKILQSERLAALGQLVAEITHEIKNPLMTIGGFARQLTKSLNNQKDLEKLNIIVAEVKRLEDLLSDLREYYLPRRLEPGPVDIRSLLQEIHSMVKADCEKRNISVTMDFEDRSHLVEGDEARLKQVFINLIKNAMEATKSDGHIHIKVKVLKEHVQIQVTDDGPGISKAHRDKIFSPFFTTKTHGSGLGLCISKRIVEDHRGGSITVTSKEGKGTTFEVLLPIYDQGDGT
ncbi:MAG: PAS domain S-box protein [Deltaproteobacteria bacterium]|nr:PAS domain S-box protein [Deltaproteobacteria bacterium]MBW1930049.1 PAS domain S-box protein [Deltaproteobacteria bacterium]